MPNKVNKKILLIEDDPDQVFLYLTKFKMEGLKLLTAKNGVEGLAMAKKEKPDIILLDIVMDEMDGMEVLERLKKNSWIGDLCANPEFLIISFFQTFPKK